MWNNISCNALYTKLSATNFIWEKEIKDSRRNMKSADEKRRSGITLFHASFITAYEYQRIMARHPKVGSFWRSPARNLVTKSWDYCNTQLVQNGEN